MEINRCAQHEPSAVQVTTTADSPLVKQHRLCSHINGSGPRLDCLCPEINKLTLIAHGGFRAVEGGHHLRQFVILDALCLHPCRGSAFWRSFLRTCLCNAAESGHHGALIVVEVTMMGGA